MGSLGPDAGTPAVRPMEAGDVPYAVDLSRSEGWDFSTGDFHRLLRLGGGRVVLVDGERAGFLTSTVYGPVAWVGNVIVDPDHRNRGLGTTLMEATLDHLSSRGVETVRLYAVLRARSLYERVGFQAEGVAASLHGRGASGDPLDHGVEPLREEDLEEVARWDRARFGADRHRLLAALLEDHPDAGFLLRGDDGSLRGFVVVKPDEDAAEVGPAVVRRGDVEAVERLLDAGLAAVGEHTCEVGVRGEATHARMHLEARGFQEAFPAVTMRWGRDAHGGMPEAQVAVAGLEKG